MNSIDQTDYLVNENQEEFIEEEDHDFQNDNQSQQQPQEEEEKKSEEQSCSICLMEYKPTQSNNKLTKGNKKAICDCIFNQICLQCLDSWVQQQVSSQNALHQNAIKIKCHMDTCQKVYNLQQIQSIYHLKYLPLTDISLFQNYLRYQYDIVNCPNPACNYRGVLSNKSCQAPLICNLCQHEWYESTQVSLWSKIKNFKEFKSGLYKYFFTKNCPQCQSPIQKNGGCNNMTCRKCNAYFCWLCLNLNGKHPISCGIKIAAKSLLLFSPVVYLFKKYGFFKLSKEYSPIKKAERWYDYILYPFRCMGLGIRFASYYAFCVSSAFFIYTGGLMLRSIINKVKTKLKNLYFSFVNKPLIVEEQIYQNARFARQSFPFACGGLLLSGLIAYFFGNKTEYKIFFGANTLYLSLMASAFIGSTF